MDTPLAHPEPPRTGLLPRLVAWLDSQPRTQLFASSGIMVAALAGLSSAIGSDIALVVFYLAPISIAAGAPSHAARTPMMTAPIAPPPCITET